MNLLEAKNWLAKMIKKTKPATASQSVRLNSGLMTVAELNELLASLPGDLLYFDRNLQFKYRKQPVDMNFDLPQLGQNFAEVEKDVDNGRQKEIIDNLSTQKQKEIHIADETNTRTRFIVDTYRPIFDKDRNFTGISEQIQDIYPLVEYYLQKTGQKLVDDPDNPQGQLYRNNEMTDSDTGASLL